MFTRFFYGFLIFFSLVALYSLHSVSSRDPTSVFFNPRVGYAPAYSTIRKQEAETFIHATTNTTERPHTQSSNTPKKLCVGIPSIARRGARYLRVAVGSLLDGLTPTERDDIYFIVFIPHSDPTVHPAYNEHWLADLTDEILVYNDLLPVQAERIKDWEKEGGLYKEKGIFDYSYLLKACYRQETPYIAMFEDDIVAMDGWYHRTVAAIEEAETRSALKKASPSFLYLRLFFTEEFLGWNSEFWFTYLFCSIVVFSLSTGPLVYLRSKSPNLKRHLSDRILLIFCGLIVALIGLFFALGRVTVLPLSAGVNEMPKYGCCSQGFVFPREKAMNLGKFFEERKAGFVDVLTEDYADRNKELRWAIMPSVIQHVGRKSSKVDDYGPMSKFGMTVAEKIWNFGFERYNADELRREHWRATHSG
ncbi:uncharacterized protein BDR25DRAFT_228781 [Lindgomyces ingoldianus]|uniref:Uncharacterized protein n=1 Tax=Lindgomyces ingoldianus TaxID=673940 RepID=A0ACB6QTU4_9PLEO|nr:uncharacterized protein BDR25DRAFT_228781 [Lindgomyces ingoldianus]KAF2469505.1 hypothetical protein BDR25DRAFT_228781 [Lindgomyces ingoldianus]